MTSNNINKENKSNTLKEKETIIQNTNKATKKIISKEKETSIQNNNKGIGKDNIKEKETSINNNTVNEEIRKNNPKKLEKIQKNYINNSNKMDAPSVKEKENDEKGNRELRKDIHKGKDKRKEKEKEKEKNSNNGEIENNPDKTGKRSFRKDSKGISRRLVNLFYAEIKVNSWQMSTDFNHKFDSKALSFISYYWKKLKISRKNYILVLLLTLTNKRIAELNKNSEFKKFLEAIENESNNPKMGLDKKLVSTVLSILYNKLVTIQKNDEEIDEKMRNYKPIQYDITKIKNAGIFN
ncbi:hypothetical protein PIROE2DRAFT_19338 [Piromyces sp. E2]|nr:hypothetical protein PIROE2DRAFT_19338 [Piromyces sp. E2]|eukprot:OUM56176.1 hypothetical protein PIROE2DRAFT_19338 [Piromyces sp. E2]